jgi:hypothetical protein
MINTRPYTWRYFLSYITGNYIVTCVLFYTLSTSNFGKLVVKVRKQLYFKLDLEQNKFWNLKLASKVNPWKYVEIMQYSMIMRHSLFFQPKVEIEHSSPQVMMWSSCIALLTVAIFSYFDTIIFIRFLVNTFSSLWMNFAISHSTLWSFF